MANVEIDGVNSKVYTDQVDPKTGTTLTLGTSGDTVSVPSGVTIANSGTATGFGDSSNFLPIAQPFFINSNMQIYQRGYNFTGVTAATTYSADRWRYETGNIGTYEMNNTQVTAGPAYNDGFRQCARIDCTTADGSPASSDYLYFGYSAEAQDCLAWKKGTTSATTMTLSFWVKSNKTGTAQVNLRDMDNGRMVSATYSISSADTWEQIIVTFPMETSNKLNNDNGSGFNFEWWLGAGSNFTSGAAPTSWEATTDADRGVNNLAINDNTANDWSITGIQAEVGSYTSSTIPPYQWETYAANLLRCQRYFQEIMSGESQNPLCNFVSYASGVLRGTYILPTQMRANPTQTDGAALSDFDILGENTNFAPTALGAESLTKNSFVVTASSSSSTQGSVYWCRGDAEATYTLDAEL